MRRNGIVLLREFLVTQLNFWTLFPAAFTVVALLCGENRIAGILTLLPLGVLPFVLYLFRRYLQNPALFLAAHGAVLAGVLCLSGPDGAAHGVRVLLTAGFLCYSLYLRLHGGMWEDRNLHPAFAAVLAGIGLSILQYYGQTEWKYLIYAAFVLVLSLYFPVVYIENYLNFLTVNTSSASHIPEREIFGSGIRLTVGYTLAGAFFLMAAADIAWFRRVLDLFLLGLRGILILLFRAAPAGKEPDGSSAAGGSAGGGGGMPMPEGEAFWLWDVVGYAVFGLFLIALCLTLWKTLRFLFRIMRGRLGMRLPKAEETVYADARDEREKLAPIRRGRRREGRRPGLFPSIEEQIRRLYRRRVAQALPDIAKLKCRTARECAEELQTPGLAVVYEKARYSGKPCSRTDLKEIKTYVR